MKFSGLNAIHLNKECVEQVSGDKGGWESGTSGRVPILFLVVS